MKSFILGLFVVLGASAFAQDSGAAEIPLCDSSMSTKSRDQLKNALAHIDSFEYIRSALKQYSAQNYTYCASGVMLTKNIYQYYKFFWSLEVRDQNGAFVTAVPMYFQSASIQAHHNAGQKPWIVVSRKDVATYVADAIVTPFASEITIPVEGEFTASNLYAIANSSAWWSQVDADTFSIVRLESQDGNEYYVGSWVYGVTSGSLYTQEFTSKIVVFKYEPEAKQVKVSKVLSGYSVLTHFLEDALVKTGQGAPLDVSTWDQYTIELSK